MSDIKQILDTIQKAVDRLSGSVATKQEPLFRSILTMLKNLDTKGDNLINNITNLKKINEIKIKIEKLIIDDKYKAELRAFAQSYSDIQNLHNDYFSKFAAAWKPTKALNVLKKTAIESTINNLTETGLQVGVTDGIRQILQKNVTAGGSYADLTEQLRNYMLTDNKGEGALERYVKTYSNTAINQFSAEYNKTIADDLGLEWYMYDGSLLETSRPFCIKCVHKKYIHASEFETILRGDFGADGHIGVSKTTGLPAGLMAGTTPENFPRRRGGWNCGHQLIAVDDIVVPQVDKDRVYASNTYKAWTAKNGKKPHDPGTVDSKAIIIPPVQSPKPESNSELILKNNKKAVKKLEKTGIVIHNDLLDALDNGDLQIKTTSAKEAYYQPSLNHIVIGSMPDREKSKYFRSTVMAHETGHAIHNRKGIITNGQVSAEFATFYEKLKGIIDGKESDIHDSLVEKIKATKDTNDREQLGVMLDVLGSLTKGDYGGGHSYSYYQYPSLSEAEVFAHSASLYKAENQYSDITDEMKEVVAEMKKYFSTIL
jgi:hypothetical protein